MSARPPRARTAPHQPGAKDAQQAAAAGKLANTGAGFNPFMVSTSVLAVALGGMIVYTVRRRKRHEL